MKWVGSCHSCLSTFVVLAHCMDVYIEETPPSYFLCIYCGGVCSIYCGSTSIKFLCSISTLVQLVLIASKFFGSFECLILLSYHFVAFYGCSI